MSLKDVCQQLKRYGVEIDADALRKTYPDEDQLARVERNLWQMLRRIEEERRTGMPALSPFFKVRLPCDIWTGRQRKCFSSAKSS
ncbi:hypothetical protein Ngar_c07200 [Candidatus Nitrososphaera gargensis Ga9.2]|uniref:Uncharacterized protein n=1 Tax=Nitrososphaera gargensis (strain Ga9.2) TaxID=1237085 RepID=K0IFQ3_NITGG|nr:hypothetical protein Ngar_c07200 [Candidatus Nitrososphaera gargensis Ga9.2]